MKNKTAPAPTVIWDALVEDVARAQRLVGAALESEHFRIVASGDGEAAVAPSLPLPLRRQREAIALAIYSEAAATPPLSPQDAIDELNRLRRESD